MVAAAVALFGILFAQNVRVDRAPVVLNLDGLGAEVDERWAGIYVGDQKIGYSLSRSAPSPEGGLLLQERTQLKLVLLGQPNDLTLSSDLRLDPKGEAESLLVQLKTEVKGQPVTLRAEGRRTGAGMEVDLYQAGMKMTSLTFDTMPATPATIYRSVVEREPDVGDVLSVPWFSPLSLGQAQATVTVVGRQAATTPGGESVDAWLLRVEHSGQVTEALIDPDGGRLGEREVEGGLGMRVQAETEQAAIHAGWPDSDTTPVDLIALSSIPLDRKLPGGGRSLQRLVLEVDGPDSLSALLERAHGDNWQPETRQLTLEVPQPGDAGLYALPSTDRGMALYTRSTTFAPSDDPAIRKAAGRVVKDQLLANDAALKLNQWIFRNIDKVPVAGVPQAREVLQSRRGDCNEHTTLYTAMARSLGLPTKMAAGIVYSESIFEDGAFYYHAWPEVWLGDRWVPVDPTFGQFPADATHIKLVEGELDKQMELMGVIGRLRLTVVDAGDGT